MDFESFKRKLSETDKELSEFFENYVSESDDKKRLSLEIKKRKKANEEAASLKKFKSAFESLGYDGESDLDDFIGTITDTIEGNNIKSTSELTDLEKRLKKLQRDFEQSQNLLNEERKSRTELEKINKNKTIESTLLPKLDKELYGARDKIKVMLYEGIVDMDESGDIVFKNGDDSMGLDDGVKWIIENNKENRRDYQQPGSGSKPPAVRKDSKYTPEQIHSMSTQEIMDNIKEVRESLST
jgi:hypothetical protein